MPAIVEAARAYVTLGEMIDVLKSVFGEYKERPIF
jgi:methylmalonyl-CoA mutase N-terminal domain/subunit